jgi:hypothetical protein
VLFLPFWVTGSLFVLGSIFFRDFYFGLILMFFMDGLYSHENIKIGLFYGMITLGSILVFTCISFAKKRLLNLE